VAVLLKGHQSVLTVLYCTALPCTVLCCTVLNDAVLCYTALYCLSAHLLMRGTSEISFGWSWLVSMIRTLKTGGRAQDRHHSHEKAKAGLRVPTAGGRAPGGRGTLHIMTHKSRSRKSQAHKSQVTSHKSQVTSHKPQVTSHRSQVTRPGLTICAAGAGQLQLHRVLLRVVRHVHARLHRPCGAGVCVRGAQVGRAAGARAP